MPKDTYQFYFQNPAGSYYYVNAAGNVDTSSTPVNITGSVPDWENLSTLRKRNSKYSGVFRKQFPDKIRLCGDGAQIVRWVKAFEGGRNAKCKFIIMKLNTTTLQYVQYGVFDFNFQIFESELLYVDTALLDSGRAAQLRAYDSTEFAIPIGDPAVDDQFKSILMDGVLLKGRVVYDFYDTFDMSLALGFGYTAPIYFTREEGSLGLTTDNANYIPGYAWPGFDFDSSYRLKTENNLDATVYAAFRYKLQLVNPLCTGIEVRAEIRGRKPSVPTLANLLLGTIDVSPGPLTFGTFVGETTSFAFSSEYYVVMYFLPLGESATLRFGEDGEPVGYMSFNYKYKQLPTPCRAITYFDLFKKLVGRMTGSFVTPPAASVLLEDGLDPTEGQNYDLNPANLMVTCGDAIRGLPSAEEIALGATNPMIKTNFESFCKDVFVSQCAGIGIETIGGVETVVCEQLSHFYQRGNLIFDMGANIEPSWRRYPYIEYVGNNIKAGYTDQNYDDVNGRYEYNSTVNWKTTDERAQNDEDYVTPYRADCYGVEYARINYGGKTSTDSESDNSTFKILTTGETAPFGTFDPDPYVLQRDQTVTAGLPADIAPTVFNVPLSPKRQIGRLLPFLKSNYYGLISPLLEFQSGTKNTNLVSTVFSFSTPEDDDVDLSATTDDILWIPEVFEITGPVPANADDLIDANQYGEIGFTLEKNGVAYPLRGFILEAGGNTANNKAMRFTLLLSPDTPAPYNI